MQLLYQYDKQFVYNHKRCEEQEMAEELQVTIPLMVRRPEEDILYVEEDNDTISDNELSSGIGRPPSSMAEGNVYSEISSRGGHLDIPKFTISRSECFDLPSRATSPTLKRSTSLRTRGHDYEKLSVTSKKSTVERISESSFFRRRAAEATSERRTDISEEEEHFLEALRQVVRKCTNADPLKRPNSRDIMGLLAPSNDKS